MNNTLKEIYRAVLRYRRQVRIIGRYDNQITIAIISQSVPDDRIYRTYLLTPERAIRML